ncbi:MAG: AAA family ATPase [Verrucomicrobia bacterium]|nr:AAA family ATPase [Verrucomicrobiota bacterium]MCH8511977.1 AAA family ATPase [Kiritimatiellia bacterium]
MINTIQLKEFKGIEKIAFDDLGRVNMIVGGNNTGKTSVLEALTLLFGSQQQITDLPKTFRQRTQRDDWKSFWPLLARKEDFSLLSITSDLIKVESGLNTNNRKSLFRSKADHDFDHRDPMVTIDSDTNGSVRVSKHFDVAKLSILSTSQPDPLVTSNLFNEIAPLNPDNEAKLQDLLRQSIEPRLRRLRYAKPKGAQDHLVYVDLGNGPMIPFTQMGQAFARALHIYCEIFALQPDILLVDEIENGLYYGGLEDFWKGLIAVLEDQNVQLFATTHSRECMEAACKANQDGKTTLRYLRLDRKTKDPDMIVGTVFDDTTMNAALEAGREMR